jgi:hypothetical protein
MNSKIAIELTKKKKPENFISRFDMVSLHKILGWGWCTGRGILFRLKLILLDGCSSFGVKQHA